MPANLGLAESELILSGKMGRELTLKRALREVKRRYDVVLIDCPPALGLLTVNALVAADHALISTEAEYFSLQGVEQALEVIELAKDSLNPELEWLGVLLNIADMRLIHSREAEEQLRERFEDKVFDLGDPQVDPLRRVGRARRLDPRLPRRARHGLPRAGRGGARADRLRQRARARGRAARRAGPGLSRAHERSRAADRAARVVAAAVWLANRVGVPYPVFLVLSGLTLGAIPGLPEIEVDPDVIFLVFLPPLIHAAAWITPHRQLRDNAGRIAVLAVGNVALSMVMVAVALKLAVPGVSWEVAFVLGAVLSPTDTVAATAVFRRLGVPERIVGLVEGESLLNDGGALVAYRVAVAAVVSGTFNLLDAGVDFVLVSVGGMAVGLALAVVIKSIRRHLDDPLIEITVTLLTPYLCWIGAEEIGASGVLAAAASGLYLGWRQAGGLHAEHAHPGVRLLGRPRIPARVDPLHPDRAPVPVRGGGARRAGGHAPAGLGARGGRGVWRAGSCCDGLGESFIRTGRSELTRGERLVVGWTGMRGAVSLAAALAIPLQTDAGTPFPARDLILFLALVTIGATLVHPGAHPAWLIRRVAIQEEVSDERAKALARFLTVEAALQLGLGARPLPRTACHPT